MIQWVLTHWPSIALAVLPLLIAQYCWGLRRYMPPAAWMFYAAFVGIFLSANSWRYVPVPAELTVETALRWVEDVRLYYDIGHGWADIAALLAAFYAIATRQFKGATLLLLATFIAARVGGHIEFTYCHLRDPVRGASHLYLLNGGMNPSCGRVAEFGIAPWAAFLGVWLMPTLTVLPSAVALWWTCRKERADRKTGPLH